MKVLRRKPILIPEVSPIHGSDLLRPQTLSPIAVALISLILIWVKPAPQGWSPNPGRIQTQEKPVFNVAPMTGIAPLFTPEVQHWESDILRWAGEWALDPNLVATVMQIESCGYSEALSPAGAAGLFQVMPFHFSGSENPFDPETNARRGLAYLSKSVQAHQGDFRLGMAGYNAGISGSQRPESQWPDETKRYIRWGTGIYQDAKEGKFSSPTLKEWLNKGGASLCNKARDAQSNLR